MRKVRDIYLIMADNIDPTLELGEAISRTTATATNFRTAYDLAISMAEVQNPAPGYRTALNQAERSKVALIACKTGSAKASIFKIKMWS